jgi:CRP/FNR family cyclic AMP-dependent transcriptional regulator
LVNEVIAMQGKRHSAVNSFLELVQECGTTQKCLNGHVLFSMGDPANSIYYIRSGTIKLSVLSTQGKEAIVAILGPGDFVGEGCIGGQPLRLVTGTAIAPCALVKITKEEMIAQIHKSQELSESFITYLLSRNLKVEQDLIDQLFNSTEKRLARALLLLAHYGTGGELNGVIPKVNQTLLAEMIGTSRPRVSKFMNKFRKMGFIKYNGGLEVHRSLLTVVLHD